MIKKQQKSCGHPGNRKQPDSRVLRRLAIAEGQIKGLREMVENGSYCIDVITQASAVRSAISSVEDILMENHLATCAIDQIKQGRAEKSREEIMKVYRLKRG
jgi:DNA-binding FrmR family transcriptional regulator